MNLVTGPIGSLAPKLLQLLQDEYKLQKGVRKKIRFLSEELDSIHGALRKVADMPPDQLDEQVKIWARQVREVSYDMEDILDTFLVRMEGPTGQGRLKLAVKRMGKLFTKAKARHSVARAIDNIKNQLQEVAERRDRCKVDKIIVANPTATSTVDPRLASCSTIDPRLEAMYREVTKLVGIDEAMGDLISMLSIQRDEVSNDKLRIVSILGTGGLGKTTLAKAVYDKLKSQFNCGAFVPVGRNPDLKKVYRDILIDLDKHKYTDVNISILDQRQLIDELREFLGCKRYFIVIDDVWEKQSWETIRLALVENNSGSKIISTTRKFEVISDVDKIYRLQSLSDENSKKLFFTRIFSREGKCPDNEADELCAEILKKCGGIPLAIITMASLLVGKSRGEWSEVCTSIGFRDRGNRQVDRTMLILSLSYYDLPCHLKTCLLYLSAFPEDYIIDKNSLIRRWIAEDFVNTKSGIGLFDVGEGYFNDLVNRSMIQAVESKYEGVIDGCRVHDMVLDLLRFLSHEENFITILSNEESTLSISTARRLVHQKSKTDAHLDNHKGMQKIRSFFDYRRVTVKELSFLRFKLLRVLDLENVFSKSWHNAEHIGSLLNLRFLGLKYTNMGELPRGIGALKFLQTLDLAGSLYIELPSSISQLTRLVCLRAWFWRMPNKVIKKLTSLEELLVHCDLDNYKGQFNELVNLNELKVLGVKFRTMNHRMLSDLLQSIGDLHKLQSIKLEKLQSIKLESQNHLFLPYNAIFHAVVLPLHLRHLLVSVELITFSRLPSCINPSCLANLSYLELRVFSVNEQSMQTLGELQELRHLVLSTESTVTNISTDGCFQKLRYCKFVCSMVQFVFNMDSSVSLTLWNGKDDIVFGSRKKDECRRALNVMPNLKELLFMVRPWWSVNLRKFKGSYGNLGLECLASLQKVTVTTCIPCIMKAEEMHAEVELRRAIDVHPNHPTLIFNRK